MPIAQAKFVSMLNDLMRRRGLSDRAVADKAGLRSRSYVHDVRKGLRIPSANTAERLIEAAGGTKDQAREARDLIGELRDAEAGTGSRGHGRPARPAPGPATPPDGNPALVATVRHRRALEPSEVTHQVARPDVVEQVLTALRARRREPGDRRVVPIRGTPGAGKSVVAGQVSDALTAAGTAVLIVPCEQLLVTPRDTAGFDLAFGSLLDSPEGLTAAVRDLATGTAAPVAVVLDTVDCVLDEHTRAALVELLWTVNRAGADIVFTCRRHDFNVFLTSARVLGPLARFTSSAVDIPALTEHQVVEMTMGFLAAHDIEPAGGREAFARRVLSLEAARKSLSDIIVNPLLLIMLCQLFARSGTVPPDLTTSRLCARYCRERVISSRKYPDDTRLADAKRRLWQRMAAELWRGSGVRLAQDVARGTLVRAEPERLAFEDLSSEGVLVPVNLDEERVRFLHQVITEYSIAIYLRDSAPGELAALFARLRADALDGWFAWQIVRHLVALSDADEARRLLDQLDLTQIPAYRAAALGVTATWRPGLLRYLAATPPVADDLAEALLAVEDPARGEALALVADVAATHPEAAVVLFRAAGELIGREPTGLDEHVASLVDVARRLCDERSNTLGDIALWIDQLLVHLVGPATERRLPLGQPALAAVRRLVPHASPVGVRAVINAHLVPGVAVRAVIALRRQVLRCRSITDADAAGIALIAAVPPWGNRIGAATGARVLRFLTTGSERSGRLRAAAVAAAANRHPPLRTGLVSAFIGADDVAGERLLICLQEVVKGGGGSWLAPDLVGHAAPATTGLTGRAAALLKAFAAQEPSLRYPLADWIGNAPGSDDAGALDAQMRLVRDDPVRLRVVLARTGVLGQDEQKRLLANLVRELDGAETDALRVIVEHMDIAQVQANGVIRARLAAKLAERDADARQRLIDLIADPSGLTSAQAVTHLRTAARARRPWLRPSMLTFLADATRPAPRLGGLQITAELVRGSAGDATEAVVAWLTGAHRRADAGGADRPAEATALLELAHAYLRDGRGRDPEALERVRNLVGDVTGPLADDNAVRKELFALFKTAVRHPDQPFAGDLGGRCVEVLDSEDLGDATDALAFAQETLGVLVGNGMAALDDLVRRARTWAPANLRMLVGVVLRHDRRGRGSPLLDEILGWVTTPDEVRQEIWRSRR
jgi:transcriptional regulator with XRE-family HTH domain